MRIGVLGLQGAVQEHVNMLRQLGVEAVIVRSSEHLECLSGLIIPGGESTTMSHLLHRYDLITPLVEWSANKLPIMGTCAGLILLASKIDGVCKEQPGLGQLDVDVMRNGFGRQRDSFEITLDIEGIAENFAAVFIRAPYIKEVGPDVKVLAQVEDKIVAVEQNNILGLSFHPELTRDDRIHAYFVSKVVKHWD